MALFPDSSDINLFDCNLLGIGSVNIFGQTRSTKRELFRSFYSNDPLQLSMKYLLPSTVLHMIRDHREPTATRALEGMSSQNLRDGLTKTAAVADRFVGSVALRVMENQQYRTPSLNTMSRKADSSEASSFQEAQGIEASLTT